MEARGRYRIQIILAISVSLILVGTASARADGQGERPIYFPPTTTVTSNPTGVVVDSQTKGKTAGVSGTGTQASGGPTCYLSEVPGSEMTEDMTTEYWARQMQDAPYYVICGGVKRGIVWVPITLDEPGSKGGTITPRDVAKRLRDEMPVPTVAVEVNPREGLVGTESWFWVQGYGGAPLTRSTNAFGDLVQVRATVMHYQWSFGDGATLTSDGLGEAYPARSDVRHVYQRSSDGMPNGYSVDVSFVFSVRYRVNGGQWIEIPGITREAHVDYPVRESQAVIQQ